MTAAGNRPEPLVVELFRDEIGRCSTTRLAVDEDRTSTDVLMRSRMLRT